LKLNRGFIIAIEGLDQSGKRTQTKLIVERLKKSGLLVEQISFPDYSTNIGREIDAFLSGRKNYNTNVRHMLLSINRWEHKNDLDRWLDEGRIIVINRYIGSNYAYGVCSGLSLDWLINLEKGLPEPDLTILFDIAHDVSAKRKIIGRDIHERDADFLSRVRKEYLGLASLWSWVVLDASKDIENVHEELWRIIRSRFESI